MTNVNKGDLAQVVRATRRFEWTLGRVVKIARRCDCADFWNGAGAVFWRFEDELRNGRGAFAHCAADACLKRIEPLTEPDAVLRDMKRELETT